MVVNYVFSMDMHTNEVIEQTKKSVLELLRKSVRPEFLNRVDEIIMFKPLSKKDIRKVVEIQFNIIKKANLLKFNIFIHSSHQMFEVGRILFIQC